MDSPCVLTGNYGELRPNHFHTGLDFSTGGKVRLPVYAIADGYVSRVKVSSVGYGKALYITHEETGKTSVYAHLTAYSAAISNAVDTEQYRTRNYEVEFFPMKNALRVRRGELIGYSGNSGNSSGPHLHFEIRDTPSEVPLNPLSFYKIIDTIAPRLLQIGFYNLADTGKPVFMKAIPVHHKHKQFFLKKDSLILDQSTIGFAFSAFDQFVPHGNPNITFSARLYQDSQLIYTHRLDQISFSDLRYVNEFSKKIQAFTYQKCFLPTLYPSSMYGQCYNKGRIFLGDTNYHLLSLVVGDEQGNESWLRFYVRTRKVTNYAGPSLPGQQVVCSSDFSMDLNGLHMHIPAATFYNSTVINVQTDLEAKATFSIFPADQNMASAFTIGIKTPARYLNHPDKLVLKNQAGVYIPTVRADSLFYAAYNFGDFHLLSDTIAPKIWLATGKKKMKRLRKTISFSLVLNDNLSGIGHYSLFLNGTWVPAEYDAKNQLLTYFFTEATPKGTLAFNAEVLDRVGNKQMFSYVLKP